MVDLTLHWANTTHLKKELLVPKRVRTCDEHEKGYPSHPVIGLIMLLRVARIRYLVIRIISLD